MTCTGCQKMARNFPIPATSASNSGGGAEAFPDVTGELQGIAVPVARGVYGIQTTKPTNNPVTSRWGPNNTSGYVPPPKSGRRKFNYGLSSFDEGAIRLPTPWVPNPNDPSYRNRDPRQHGAIRKFQYTDDGGSAGGQGAGAASGGANRGRSYAPQSNRNQYNNTGTKLRYGDGPQAFWSWKIAKDAEQVQKAFGFGGPMPARPFTRKLNSETTAGLEGAAVGLIIGTLLVAPFVWTRLGRSLARQAGGGVKRRTKEYVHRHTT